MRRAAKVNANRLTRSAVTLAESRLEQAQQEITENEGVIKVWRRRTAEAETKLATAQQEIARLAEQIELLRQALNGTGE